MASKAKCQRLHAKRRAAQRYDMTISRNDIRALVTLIQSNKGQFIERQSLRITVWKLEYNGKKVKVVYDSHRKEIVTFLPIEEEPCPTNTIKTTPTG